MRVMMRNIVVVIQNLRKVRISFQTRVVWPACERWCWKIRILWTICLGSIFAILGTFRQLRDAFAIVLTTSLCCWASLSSNWDGSASFQAHGSKVLYSLMSYLCVASSRIDLENIRKKRIKITWGSIWRTSSWDFHVECFPMCQKISKN